jgi:D-alanyl-D-alanine dipeptidase
MDDDKRTSRELIMDLMEKRGLMVTSEEWKAAIKRARG